MEEENKNLKKLVPFSEYTEEDKEGSIEATWIELIEINKIDDHQLK